MKIELVKNKGQWHFRVKAKNGRIICSSETYKRKSDAARGAECLCELGPWTEVEIVVVDGK
jgi:uncharacterized protein YegP (UPF0339 family)